MFTGIIEEMGVVETVEAQPGRMLLVVRAPATAKSLRLGESIAVSGACLTVVREGAVTFAVELVPETVRRTTLGEVEPGDQVNLERSLTADGRFGGHMVQGHVEGAGEVVAVEPDGDALTLRIALPPALSRYVVVKGFVAVDGVSLTVVDCSPEQFSVSVIPYTQQHTTLAGKRPGDWVNLETDVVARYVERLIGNLAQGG